MSHRHPAVRRPRRLLAEIRNHLPPLPLVATLGFVLVVLALVLLVRPANAGSRTLTESYEPKGANRFEFSVPFADLKIEGVESGPVRVRIEATCEGDRHCDEYLEDMRLEATRRGNALRVKLRMAKLHAGLGLDLDEDDDDDGWNGRRDHARHGDHDRSRRHDSNLRVVIQVPRSLSVDCNVGAGEVDVEGLRHDVSIDMGAGEVSVRMREREVRAVDVHLAVGEALIRQGGRTREYSRVLGGPIHWSDGRGSAEIEVHLGAGEVDVTLD